MMKENYRSIARTILLAFVLTFACARILVYLIMARVVPDLYFFVGTTHVHHLNYGIFLLSGVGAFLLFKRPKGRWLTASALAYGVGLGLTFDEFGMWLHLGGGYWQRASFDAVITILALLGLISFMPRLRTWTPKRFLWAGIVAIITVIFFWKLIVSLDFAGRWGPHLRQLESGDSTRAPHAQP
ncbi:hypothetical protein [Oleiharenicola lentus]|uniref:hypothetical protein n=1 Tax=Oleiharenicola lentus TaxID=2508720 RepID=UPI003F67718F